MTLEFRTVTVKQLFETVNEDQEWEFFEELKKSLYEERPRIVLNCSALDAFEESSLHLLLCCLEEAMKRNGDVRLSSLRKPARAALEAAGLDQLFKMYDSDTEAVKSFQRLPAVTPGGVRKQRFYADTDMRLESLPFRSTEDAA